MAARNSARGGGSDEIGSRLFEMETVMRLKLAAPLAVAVAGAFAIPALAETNEVYTPIQATPRVYYTPPTYYVPSDTYYIERDYYVPETPTVYSYTPETTSYYVEPQPVYY